MVYGLEQLQVLAVVAEKKQSPDPNWAQQNGLGFVSKRKKGSNYADA